MVKRRLDEAVFSFIYAEAMDDATRRTDAASIKSDILAVKSIKKLVKEYSDKVIAGDNPDFYEYENKIEKVIKKKGDKLKDFTFGNIQKLMNMTMKYLYIKYYDSDIAKYFECCHAPLDSTMLDKVRKAAKDYDIYSQCSWSKISKDTDDKRYSVSNYKNYQEVVHYLAKKNSKCRNRLDYEFIYYN